MGTYFVYEIHMQEKNNFSMMISGKNSLPMLVIDAV